jgi:CubicO group peptidase (beta-lactamase class C family)
MSHRIVKKAVAHSLLGCAAFVFPLFAQTERAEKIDAVFQSLNNLATPGAAVAVIEHGKKVYEKGYGSANLEYNIPIGPDTIFHVASVSKQFTAMAIVLLERDGKLSIDDDVHKYLPELPDYGYKITLRNLLQHTSGVRDQWQTLGIAGWSLEDVITQDQILRILFRQKELNFPPGSKYLYSNGGFTLLAEIVKRVSGKPLPDYCEERIFRPLGMTRTHFHLDLHQIVPGRAYSYAAAQNGGFENAPLNYSNVGATSLFTTAGDLVKWLDNFRDPKVGGAAGIARLQEQGVLSNGQKIDYGLGIAIDTYRGLRRLEHSGGDAGFRSEVMWFPDQELGLAVVSNLASFNPTQAAAKVAELYLSEKMSPPKQAPATVPLETEALQRFAGTYGFSDAGMLRATVDQGKLWLVPPGGSRLELKPVGTARFYLAGTEENALFVEFISKPDAGMTAKVIPPTGAPTQGDRIAPMAPPTSEELARYAGVYWSEELETQYTILVRGGGLVAVHAHHGEFPLTANGKDQFRSNQWFFPDVKFISDERGNVTAMTVGGGRVTAIRFQRK